MLVKRAPGVYIIVYEVIQNGTRKFNQYQTKLNTTKARVMCTILGMYYIVEF